ncbi:MAG: class I SAM-dependent methyltransferase, partial [Pirellulales bacterium]
DDVEKRVIRGHYDLSTPFYRLLWGPHIHHGYWDADESPRAAQLQLTERLAALAQVSAGERMLDVGCGMGGSSIHLARSRGCHAVGITISPLQRLWAAAAARWHRVAARTEFCCADAEQIAFEPASFDLVWSVECTEHLFDKPRFFQRAAEWLRPGGTMAICAWLSGEKLDDAQARQVYDVCEGFFCPSLGASGDYVEWMTAAGLQMNHTLDWTDRVTRTWEICRDRVARTRVRSLARWIDRDSVMFLDRFETILAAYRSGAMRYGCFVARKPFAA